MKVGKHFFYYFVAHFTVVDREWKSDDGAWNDDHFNLFAFNFNPEVISAFLNVLNHNNSREMARKLKAQIFWT